MTIEQLIDELSNLGAVIGIKTEVRAWYLGNEPLHPLDVIKPTGVSAGWDKSTQQPIAEIKITP